MQFNMLNTLVRKLYVLKEEGFIANQTYLKNLEHLLSQEEFEMLNMILESDDIQKAVDYIQHAYTSTPSKKQSVTNILSEPKMTQIALILLDGSKPQALQKAIHTREHIDKNSVHFLELIENLQDKLLTFVTSRVSKFPSNTSPKDYLKTLSSKEISISNVARYFGGDFERAYLDDKGIGKSYYEFLVSQVLLQYHFIEPQDAYKFLLISIWNAIPAFRSKTRFTSVGGVH